MSYLLSDINIVTATTTTVPVTSPGDYLVDCNPKAGTVTVSQRGRALPSFDGITARETKVVALGTADVEVVTTGGSVDVDFYLDKITD